MKEEDKEELKDDIISKVMFTNNEELLLAISKMVENVVEEPQAVYKLSDAERASIERGIEDYRNGRFTTNEDLEKNDKWLNG